MNDDDAIVIGGGASGEHGRCGLGYGGMRFSLRGPN
jgi:hypothetical protein